MPRKPENVLSRAMEVFRYDARIDEILLLKLGGWAVGFVYVL
jgi:hypothetical protein